MPFVVSVTVIQFSIYGSPAACEHNVLSLASFIQQPKLFHTPSDITVGLRRLTGKAEIPHFIKKQQEEADVTLQPAELYTNYKWF